MSDARKPRRPAFRDPAALEELGERHDPIAQLHAAHETAAALLGVGRAAHDPAVTARLVAVVDDVGLSTLAEVWAARPALTLPGALYRLYVLREWVRNDPTGVAREYEAGIRFTEPNHAVAGADPAGPEEVVRVADEILRGVFAGDVGVALERAAAFAHVVAAGRADVTPGLDAVTRAGRLQQLAGDLTAAARLWRTDDLR